ncbi:MAG: RlmE family RNA methyltransferase [Candidatus Hadarchaeales archaeon]
MGAPPRKGALMAWRREEAYRRLARKMGYRARSAFKLKQLSSRYSLLHRGEVVVDLGAAPGGWMQVSREEVGEEGFVLGVDLQPIPPFQEPNVRTLVGDLLDPSTAELILSHLPRKADVLLSDASPKISGVWRVDHARSLELAEAALRLAEKVLREGGKALIKVFQGEGLEDFLREFRRRFEFTKVSKPPASRKGSAEVYVVGKGYRGISGRAPRSSQRGHPS